MKKRLGRLAVAAVLLLAVAFFPVPQKTVVTFPVAVREAQEKDYWEPTVSPCTMTVEALHVDSLAMHYTMSVTLTLNGHRLFSESWSHPGLMGDLRVTSSLVYDGRYNSARTAVLCYEKGWQSAMVVLDDRERGMVPELWIGTKDEGLTPEAALERYKALYADRAGWQGNPAGFLP